MSDDEQKKPEKQFFDEKTGIIHGHECPKTKKEFGEAAEGGCQLEEFFRTGDYMSNNPCMSSGPAQVASQAYRDGHDRIFGTRAPVGKA